MALAVAIATQFQHIGQVEIVPGFLLPSESLNKGWVVVDGVLGIHDKALAKAYTALCMAGIERSSPQNSLLSLLATTDNLSVANSRKDMCIARTIEPADDLRILDIVLSSPLFKHSKSSVLWSHRQWLITEFALSTTLEQEWNVVARAAEHHPKNYYAWGYFRWFCAHFRIWEHPEYTTLVQNIQGLCLRNLSDVSIWSFLAWLGAPELVSFAEKTNQELPGHEAIQSSIASMNKQSRSSRGDSPSRLKENRRCS